MTVKLTHYRPCGYSGVAMWALVSCATRMRAEPQLAFACGFFFVPFAARRQSKVS